MTGRKKLLALLGIASSTSMIFLDSTILPVAIPTIQSQLGVSTLQLQWMINAYPLAIAALALIGGRVADIYGHRRLFCLGLLIFSCASALGGLATAGWWLIASRALQGVGGAFMGPSALSLMMEIFSDKERGKAVGSLVAISSLFLSIGPFLGGLLTQYFSWRLLFWINLPIAGTGILLALITIPISTRHKQGFDLLGAFSLVIGLLSLTLFLMQGREWGWSSLPTLSCAGLALIALALFPLSEKLSHAPFLELSLFKNPLFKGGNLIVLFTQALLMMTVYWAIYFQSVLSLTPAQAGTMTLAATLPILFFAPTAGHLFDKIGPRVPIALGFSLIIFGFLWFYRFLSVEKASLLIPGLLAYGAGIPLVLTPTSTTTLSSVPHHLRGAASGTYNTMRYIGATLGVALIGSVLDGAFRFRFDSLIKGNPKLQTVDPALLWGLEHPDQKAAVGLSHLSTAEIKAVASALEGAHFFAYSTATLLALSMAVAGLLISFYYFRRYKSQ